MKVSCVPRLILSAFSWMFNSGCTHASIHDLKDARNEQSVRVSVAYVLQIRYSCHFLSLALQRIICCCVRRASCQTWCYGTKTTLMMVDSRKGQQVVQLVCPMLRRRNIIKSSISQSRAEKSWCRVVVIVLCDMIQMQEWREIKMICSIDQWGNLQSLVTERFIMQ